MLPPFLGALVLLATGGLVLLSLGGFLLARRRGDAFLKRLSTGLGGVAGFAYAFLWLLGLALARPADVVPGETVRFCGLDCHLHVSVDGVRSASPLIVRVRFSSNAVRAPEHPGALRFRLVDRSGREFSPRNAVPDSVLRAGSSWTHDLEFPAEAAPTGAALLVTWKPGLDYLVPGEGNPLVQRRHRLMLPPPPGLALWE